MCGITEPLFAAIADGEELNVQVCELLSRQPELAKLVGLPLQYERLGPHNQWFAPLSPLTLSKVEHRVSLALYTLSNVEIIASPGLTQTRFLLSCPVLLRTSQRFLWGLNNTARLSPVNCRRAVLQHHFLHAVLWGPVKCMQLST